MSRRKREKARAAHLGTRAAYTAEGWEEVRWPNTIQHRCERVSGLHKPSLWAKVHRVLGNTRSRGGGSTGGWVKEVWCPSWIVLLELTISTVLDAPDFGCSVELCLAQSELAEAVVSAFALGGARAVAELLRHRIANRPIDPYELSFAPNTEDGA